MGVLSVVVMYDASRLAMLFPSTNNESVTPVKVTAMWCHAPLHTAELLVSRPSPARSTVTMPHGLFWIQMRNTLCDV